MKKATSENKKSARNDFWETALILTGILLALAFWQHLDNARCNNTNPCVTENVRSCHNKNPLNIFAYIIIVLIILACEIL